MPRQPQVNLSPINHRSKRERGCGRTGHSATGFAVIDFLLLIACVALGAAACWRLLTLGFTPRDTPLYLIAVTVPVYLVATAFRKARATSDETDSESRNA